MWVLQCFVLGDRLMMEVRQRDTRLPGQVLVDATYNHLMRSDQYATIQNRSSQRRQHLS